MHCGIPSVMMMTFIFFVRCEDFIVSCFITFKLGQKCCGDIFDPKPYFTKSGVCFETKKQFKGSSSNDEVVITLNAASNYTAGDWHNFTFNVQFNHKILQNLTQNLLDQQQPLLVPVWLCIQQITALLQLTKDQMILTVEQEPRLGLQWQQ